MSGSLLLKNAVRKAVTLGRPDCLHCLLHSRERCFSKDFIEYITWISRQESKDGIVEYLEEFFERHGDESFGRRDPISVPTLLSNHALKSRGVTTQP